MVTVFYLSVITYRKEGKKCKSQTGLFAVQYIMYKSMFLPMQHNISEITNI